MINYFNDHQILMTIIFFVIIAIIICNFFILNMNCFKNNSRIKIIKKIMLVPMFILWISGLGICILEMTIQPTKSYPASKYNLVNNDKLNKIQKEVKDIKQNQNKLADKINKLK